MANYKIVFEGNEDGEFCTMYEEAEQEQVHPPKVRPRMRAEMKLPGCFDPIL